jgi:phage terminase large subunit-like protein
MADCFAVVMVTRHPDRPADVMVRYCGIWQATPGELLNFQPIEEEIRRLCRDFSVIEVAYDPHQLHDMATRLKTAHIANFKPFGQGKDRQLADKQLQDVIMARRIAHDGNPALRQHIDNADVKKYGVGEGIRLVKRSTSQKIDASVATSMAVSRCLYYNLG